MNNGFRWILDGWTRKQPMRLKTAPPRVDLSLHDWRARPDLVSQSQVALRMPHVRLMVEVLGNESPVNYHAPGLSAERALGQIEGYQMALNNLAAMGTPSGERITLEATFEPENNNDL